LIALESSTEKVTGISKLPETESEENGSPEGPIEEQSAGPADDGTASESADEASPKAQGPGASEPGKNDPEGA
jgi:DNA gyrase subunit A